MYCTPKSAVPGEISLRRVSLPAFQSSPQRLALAAKKKFPLEWILGLCIIETSASIVPSFLLLLSHFLPLTYTVYRELIYTIIRALSEAFIFH